MSSSRDIVHIVCIAEQVALLENSKAFFPKLEAVAKTLKIAADIPDNRRIFFYDLIKIADILDARIFQLKREYFPNNVKGFLLDLEGTRLDLNFRYAIFVREDEPDCAKLFCIGHEIGHIACGHSVLTNTKSHHNFREYRVFLRNEFEAGHVASSLLLGKKHFLQILEKNNYIFEDVADYYDVSYERILNRLAVIDFKPDIHFVKIKEESGKLHIEKHFIKSTSFLELSSMQTPCHRMSACKVFDREKYPEVLCQNTKIVDEFGNECVTLFCLSRLITKKIDNAEEQKYSITIGCLAGKEAEKIFGHYIKKYPPIEEIISVPHCGTECSFEKEIRTCVLGSLSFSQNE